MTHRNFLPRRSLQSWLIQSSVRNMKQKFDYLLALDFEATCLKDRQIQPQEIIEFPCLKIETKDFDIVDEFHSYVRPIFNPKLSEFCIELTGILQETVENEPEFSQVLTSFENWLELDTNFAFVTCGDWDLKKCLPNQCQASGIAVPSWSRQWINLKKIHQKNHGHFPRSLAEILRQNGLKFEGRPHSGIDDTKNIARVIKALGIRGCNFEIT